MRLSIPSFSIKSLLYAGFVFAGYFKADPRLDWVRVDVTLLLGFLVAMTCIFSLSRANLLISRRAVEVAGLFALLAIPMLWAPPTSEYGVVKVARLFSITFLAILAPIILIRRPKDALSFINAFLIVGLILAFDALITGRTASEYEGAQLVASGSGPIALGRAAGQALVITVIAMATRSMNVVLGTAFAVVLAMALISSGSRGPLLAAAIAAIAVSIFSKTRERPLWIRRLAAAAIVLAVAMFVFSAAPKLARERIDYLVSGELGTSERARLSLYDLSLEIIAQNPQGVGWGGFADYHNIHIYSHNLLLEVAVEAGLGVAILFAIWIVRMIRLARANASGRAGQTLFALTIFFFINAMVSGDINDNRPLFTAFGGVLAIAAFEHRRRSRARPPVEPAARTRLEEARL